MERDIVSQALAYSGIEWNGLECGKFLQLGRAVADLV